MKKSYLKKIGKRGKINIEANKKLKEIYAKTNIRSCEIKLEGCLGEFTCAFVHRHKRSWYYRQPELLSDFNQTLWGCQNCHDKIEHNEKLTEETFKRLR